MYSLPNLHKLSCASKSRFDNVDAGVSSHIRNAANKMITNT